MEIPDIRKLNYGLRGNALRCSPNSYCVILYAIKGRELFILSNPCWGRAVSRSSTSVTHLSWWRRRCRCPARVACRTRASSCSSSGSLGWPCWACRSRTGRPAPPCWWALHGWIFHLKWWKTNMRRNETRKDNLKYRKKKKKSILHFEQCNQQLSNLIWQSCDGSMKILLDAGNQQHAV